MRVFASWFCSVLSLLSGLFGATTAALGAETGAEDSLTPHIPDWLWSALGATWYGKATIGLGALAVGWFGRGFIGPTLAKDWLALRGTRRDFGQKITEQVNGLATTHYWALANQAGVLAVLLEEYLQLIDYHLLVTWSDKKDFHVRMQTIAQDRAEQSFHEFCRLIWLMDKFQFQGSNTYLLTSVHAGRTCRQLYNHFVTQLPLVEDEASPRLNTLNILATMGRRYRDTLVEATTLGAELAAEDFNRILLPQKLSDEFAAYSAWLMRRPERVLTAASALRALNETLNHELALLYRDWFGRSTRSRQAYEQQVTGTRWPGVLTAGSVRAINVAALGSELLAPLGRSERPQSVPATTQRKPSPTDQAPSSDDISKNSTQKQNSA